MSKTLIDIPEELHDKLRHKSIDTKIKIQELIIKGIKQVVE